MISKSTFLSCNLKPRSSFSFWYLTRLASVFEHRRKKVLEAMMHLSAQNVANSVIDGHSAARMARNQQKSASPPGLTRSQIYSAVGTALIVVLALAISSRTRMETWISHSLANSTLFGLDVLYVWRGILVFVLASVVTDVGEAYLPLDGELAAKSKSGRGALKKHGIMAPVTQARKNV